MLIIKEVGINAVQITSNFKNINLKLKYSALMPKTNQLGAKINK